MRIVLICAAGIVSGKEIMSLHLLREMKARGHDCFCVVSSWGSEDFRNRLRQLGIPFYNLRIGFISKTLTWSAVGMTLVQLIHMPALLLRFVSLRRKLKPELIIHTNFHHVFLLYPVLQRIGNLYWSHEVIVNSPFYRRLFQLFYEKISCFVCVSDAVAASISSLIGDAGVTTIKNGCLMSGEVKMYRNSEEAMVLAIIGQVSKSKGHEILIEALEGIARERFRLRIIGSGAIDYVAHLKELIDRKGLGTNVEWMGFVRDTNQIYDGVDAVIVPSIFPDPYPTTVMEAGQRAIPVVVSAIGGLPEMVLEGVNGFLAEPGNPESLRSAVNKILDHRDFDTIKAQSFRFAERNFSMDRFASEFQVLIDKYQP